MENSITFSGFFVVFEGEGGGLGLVHMSRVLVRMFHLVLHINLRFGRSVRDWEHNAFHLFFFILNESPFSLQINMASILLYSLLTRKDSVRSID